MRKIIVCALGMSVFLFAEYMSESDLLIQQDLENIKNKYHIQDEEPPQIQYRVKEEIPLKKETRKPNITLRVDKPTQVDNTLNRPNVSKNEDKLTSIRRELGIKELTGKEKKLDQIRHELDINYEVPKKESYLDKRVSSVQEALHMDGEIDGEYSFRNSVRDLKKTLHLDAGSSWDLGLPSFFGEEKKKKKKSMFGLSIFGDVKDTGTSIYKGMKYSGQSAEMMSGMMYNSSKMYNTMFGLFDDSPFNIFEEEEESSMFDFIQGGNAVMDFLN